MKKFLLSLALVLFVATGALAVPLEGYIGSSQSEGNLRPVKLDDTSGALITINHQHHHAHEGEVFVLANSVTLGASNEYEIRIATPNTTKRLNLVYAVISDSSVTVTLFEGTAKTHEAGNALTPYNRNRASSNTTTATICHTPGAGADGTQLVVWSGGSNSPVGGGAISAEREEWILKSNTAYLINISGTQNDVVTYDIEWYEHTAIN